jgi:hypothetical protein
MEPKGHVVASELSCAKRRGHEARSGPGAASSLVAGAGVTRHVTAPELPCARRWEPRGTQACASVFSFILTWSLYTWYPVFRVPTDA